mmetsp:Transcript_801/g.1812  ORF Transcript_801/g.1812 Transcript_801/m.1812 type:complete len:245 (+) Transcript_801:474-1208(+)
MCHNRDCAVHTVFFFGGLLFHILKSQKVHRGAFVVDVDLGASSEFFVCALSQFGPEVMSGGPPAVVPHPPEDAPVLGGENLSQASDGDRIRGRHAHDYSVEFFVRNEFFVRDGFVATPVTFLREGAPHATNFHFCTSWRERQAVYPQSKCKADRRGHTEYFCQHRVHTPRRPEMPPEPFPHHPFLKNRFDAGRVNYSLEEESTLKVKSGHAPRFRRALRPGLGRAIRPSEDSSPTRLLRSRRPW